MDSDTSSKPRRVVQAREILDKIERGEDVEYDRVIVEGGPRSIRRAWSCARSTWTEQDLS